MSSKTDFYSFTLLLQYLQSFDFHRTSNVCVFISTVSLSLPSDLISFDVHQIPFQQYSCQNPQQSHLLDSCTLLYQNKTKHDTWLPFIHLLCCRLLNVGQEHLIQISDTEIYDSQPPMRLQFATTHQCVLFGSFPIYHRNYVKYIYFLLKLTLSLTLLLLNQCPALNGSHQLISFSIPITKQTNNNTHPAHLSCNNEMYPFCPSL